MMVYRNILTGEYRICESKIRAWLYFFDKAQKRDDERPTMDDITVIEIDKRIIDLKVRKDEDKL